MSANLSGRQLRAIRVALDRAVESGDDVTAQELSVVLAPYVEAECERMDADPKALIPAWGVES